MPRASQPTSFPQPPDRLSTPQIGYGAAGPSAWQGRTLVGRMFDEPAMGFELRISDCGGCFALRDLDAKQQAAIAAAKAQDNDNSTIVSSGGDDLSRAAEIALKNRIDIPPTIRIASGTPIQVFVAKDLDFAGAPAASE